MRSFKGFKPYSLNIYIKHPKKLKINYELYDKRKNKEE